MDGHFLRDEHIAAADVNTSFQTGFHYDWWASDDHDKGMQFYVPLVADAEYKISLSGSWVHMLYQGRSFRGGIGFPQPLYRYQAEPGLRTR